MGNQLSINEIQGTIGKLTFYKHPTGYKVRKKSSLNKHRVMTYPKMLSTRQNMAEFGHASKAGALIRHTVGEHLALARDTFTSSRLLKACKQIVNTDVIHEKGLRRINFGDLTLLKGFDFNIDARLESIFQCQFTSRIDRISGVMQIDIAPFVSADMLRHPVEATHFRFISSGCELDFKKESFVADNQTSGYYAMDDSLTPAVSLMHHVRAGSGLLLFQMLGVQYFELVNGKYEMVKAKAFNPLAIIGVDKA